MNAPTFLLTLYDWIRLIFSTDPFMLILLSSKEHCRRPVLTRYLAGLDLPIYQPFYQITMKFGKMIVEPPLVKSLMQEYYQ
ncbi:hypothetical protein Hanom_Chr05g00402721 [Helianthus anomalus]